MKAAVQVVEGKLVITLALTNTNDAETLGAMMVEVGAINDATIYAEPGRNIYGITGRSDGRVLVGPNGESPKMEVRLF